MSRFNFTSLATVLRHVYSGNKSTIEDPNVALLGFLQPIDSDNNTIALGIVGQAYQFVTEGQNLFSGSISLDIQKGDRIYIASESSQQLLADNEMEESGVGAWNAEQSAILTKEIGGIFATSTQFLRVTYGDGVNPRASQNVLVAGKKYIIAGFAKSDGTQIAEVRHGLTTVFTSTNSTNWQAFVKGFEADVNVLRFQNTGTAGYVDFDSISLQEAEEYIVRGVKRNEMKGQDFVTAILEKPLKE